MPTVDEILGQAGVLAAQGRLDEAAAAYCRAIELEPANIAAQGNLGNLLRITGRLDEAAACYRRILAQTDSSLAHNDLGQIAQAQGKLDEAIACYRRAIERAPTFAEAHSNLGTALARVGRLDEAIACCRRAIELKPGYAIAHSDLAVILLAAGRHQEAADCCRRSLQLEPRNAQAHYVLGQALAHQNQLNEAAQCYRQATALVPGFAEAHANLAVVYERQGKLEDAANCCRRVVELLPQAAGAHDRLGTVLFQQAKLAEAVSCFRRAILIAPGSAEVHCHLGTALAQQRQFAEAAASFQRALQLAPESADAHVGLGLIAQLQGSLNEAAAQFRRAIQLKPNHPDAHFRLGALLATQERWDEAAACYRRVTELEPNLAETFHRLAAILTSQEKADEAIACYRRAIALRPDFAEAYNNLATVLSTQEKLAEAEACCRRALDLKPDYTGASSNLCILLTHQGRVAEAKECYLSALRFHPELDALRLNVLSLCPVVFPSSSAIAQFRQRLLDDLGKFAKTERGTEFPPQVTSFGTPSFNLQFHGLDERPTREAYARIFRRSFPSETPRGSQGRRRIGIVVTDRHEDLFIRSLGGVLERIDADLFELVIVGGRRSTDVVRAAIHNRAIGFLAAGSKLVEMSAAIRAAQFDVVYYWEVGTDSANYLLPFSRLAPVQCTSWGIQVTSGIPGLDYYLSSELVEADDAANHYTEKLILARTLLTYQQRAAAPIGGKSRADFGIDAEAHLYLCAQQLGKFHPDFDPMIAEILRRDRQGVLAITEGRQGGYIAAQLKSRFAATIGDVLDRIVFVPRLATPDYLSLVATADVLLDPLHFGGVNTTYDGFSLNKPIVTLPSRFHRGRYTLGCYNKMAAGHAECVASGPEHYVELALALGTDAERRRAVVDLIAAASPALFEDPQAVAEHERLFTMLIEESAARAARE